MQRNRLLQMVEEAKTIAVLGHIRPDGDCVGSCLAVCNYLKEQYPEKKRSGLSGETAGKIQLS